MTPNEFKLKYPQHSHLEGDDLWDKMTEVVLQQDNVLYADPTQAKQWLEPITLNLLQDDGTYAKSSVTIEDSSTTRWLNKDGELVRIGESEIPVSTTPTESYSFVIMDFGDEK